MPLTAQDGDLLAIGTKPSGRNRLRFLGSRQHRAAQPGTGPGRPGLGEQTQILALAVFRSASNQERLRSTSSCRGRRRSGCPTAWRPVTGQPGHHVGNLFGRHELLQALLALRGSPGGTASARSCADSSGTWRRGPSSPPSPPSACRSSTGWIELTRIPNSPTSNASALVKRDQTVLGRRVVAVARRRLQPGR